MLTLCSFRRIISRAAADLGANAFQTFWHVILPLTMPGIMTGAFLTFVLCIGDYVAARPGGNNELVLPQIIMLQLAGGRISRWRPRFRSSSWLRSPLLTSDARAG